MLTHSLPVIQFMFLYINIQNIQKCPDNNMLIAMKNDLHSSYNCAPHYFNNFFIFLANNCENKLEIFLLSKKINSNFTTIYKRAETIEDA